MLISKFYNYKMLYLLLSFRYINQRKFYIFSHTHTQLSQFNCKIFYKIIARKYLHFRRTICDMNFNLKKKCVIRFAFFWRFNLLIFRKTDLESSIAKMIETSDSRWKSCNKKVLPAMRAGLDFKFEFDSCSQFKKRAIRCRDEFFSST